MHGIVYFKKNTEERKCVMAIGLNEKSVAKAYEDGKLKEGTQDLEETVKDLFLEQMITDRANGLEIAKWYFEELQIDRIPDKEVRKQIEVEIVI